MRRGEGRRGIRGFGLPIWTQYVALVSAAAAYLAISFAVTGERASSMLSLLTAVAVFLIAYAFRRPRDIRVADGRVTVVDSVTKRELRTAPASDVTLVRSGSCYADVSDMRIYLARSSLTRMVDAVTTK